MGCAINVSVELPVCTGRPIVSFTPKDFTRDEVVYGRNMVMLEHAAASATSSPFLRNRRGGERNGIEGQRRRLTDLVL